jgi:threonine aldolase
MTDEEIARLRAACPRALTHHVGQTPHNALRELAEATPPELLADKYGSGEWLAGFEATVAAELGKEAAVFMPSGTMAQQIALRIWCERRACRTIAFHPTCHLEIHESRGYALLHGLRALLVGQPTRLMTVEDVRAVADPLGAFVVELPQRELGAQLPEWNELCELVRAARGTGAAVHLDGARLWEAAPHYGRTHAEIAGLFESVYVSFYKGLGALAGAMLAGDADFIAEARQWQHRHGGRLVTIAPLALSARLGYERNLPKMAAYRHRAREIAERLARLDGLEIVPAPPQTNTFHIFLRGDRAALEASAHAYARERGTFVFARLAPTVVPTLQKWEFVVGDATLALDVDDVERAVRAVLASVRTPLPLANPENVESRLT